MNWFLSQVLNHREFIQSSNNESDEQFNIRMANNLGYSDDYKLMFEQSITEFTSRNKRIEYYKNLIFERSGEDVEVKELILIHKGIKSILSKCCKALIFLDIIRLFQEQDRIINELQAKVLKLLK